MRQTYQLQSLNIFTIFLMVMWKPFGTFVLQMTGHTVIIAVIAAMVMMLNVFVNAKEVGKALSSKPMVIWTLLTLYAVVNSLVKGYGGDEYNVGGGLSFFAARFVLPYILLLLCLVELRRDKKAVWRTLFYGTFVFTLITVALTRIGGENRFDADSSEIGNDLAITAAVCLFLGMVRYLKAGVKLFYPVAIGIYAMVITMLTQTRTALGAIAIMSVGFVLSLPSKSKWRNLLLVLVMAGGMYFVMDRVVGRSSNDIFARIERDEFRDLQLVGNEGTNRFLLMLLGSRAIHYVMGFEVVRSGNYPITGIGVGNFMTVAQWRNALHSEYMVQLVENGIIGFTLLVLLYFYIIRGLRKANKRSGTSRIFLWGIFALLFMNLVTWSYEKYWAMIVYALAINEIATASANTPRVVATQETSEKRIQSAT